MLVYLDNRARRPQHRRAQPRHGSQREPRARDPRAAHAGRRRRLHPGRRHQPRPRHHRLDRRQCRRESGEPGKFFFAPRGTSRATGPCSASAIPTAACGRATRCCASWRPSGDGAAHRPQAGGAFRGGGATPGARCASGEDVPRHRRRSRRPSPRRWRRRRGVGGASRQGAAALRLPGRAGARLCPRAEARPISCGSLPSSASRCGDRRHRQAGPRPIRRGRRLPRCASGCASPRWQPARPIVSPTRARWRRTCSAMGWAAPPARPWRALSTREQGLELLIMSPEFQRR